MGEDGVWFCEGCGGGLCEISLGGVGCMKWGRGIVGW